MHSYLFGLPGGDLATLHYSTNQADDFHEFVQLAEKFAVHDSNLRMSYRVPVEYVDRFHNLLKTFQHRDWGIRRRAGGGRGPRENHWDTKDTLIKDAKYFRYYIDPCRWLHPWK